MYSGLRIQNMESLWTIPQLANRYKLVALLFCSPEPQLPFLQVVLSEKDADVVKRAASNRVPDPNVDIYADHIPWFR